MDQAKKLREMMDSLKNKNIKNSFQESQDNNLNGRVISISSGKGGVGKTNFSINFSLVLKELGYKVLILDADIGLGNVEILSNAEIDYSISDMINLNKSIDDIIGEGPNGVKIISGGSGMKELVLLDKNNFNIILNGLEKLQNEFDFIVIDTGAGISPAVLDFIMASDEVIVIGTPDPTSVMDAYVLIKSIIINGFNGKIHLVSNLVKNSNQGKDIYYKINNASEKFINTKVNYLGYILKDEKVSQAVRKQTPFLLAYPNRTVSKQVRVITDNLLRNENKVDDNMGFAEKLLNIFIK